MRFIPREAKRVRIKENPESFYPGVNKPWSAISTPETRASVHRWRCCSRKRSIALSSPEREWETADLRARERDFIETLLFLSPAATRSIKMLWAGSAQDLSNQTSLRILWLAYKAGFRVCFSAVSACSSRRTGAGVWTEPNRTRGTRRCEERSAVHPPL